jgi:hypothetical protein
MDYRYTIKTPPDWMIYLVGGFYFVGPLNIEAAHEICQPRIDLCGSVARLPDNGHQREPAAQ